jgi:hypothetical protein
MEITAEVECPHCGEVFETTIEVDPADWNDLD